jgi:hypothetical protein
MELNPGHQSRRTWRESQPAPFKLQRLPREVWGKMNQEARDKYLQVRRRHQGIKRSGRGRGCRLNQSQRSDGDPEVDMAEVSNSKI